MPRSNRPARGGKRPGAGRPPGSKNKVPREVSVLARDFGPEALDILIAIARDKRQPAASRISACALVLDRGFGRSPQAIDLSLKYADPETLSDRELTQIIREGQRYRSGRNGAADERDLH